MIISELCDYYNILESDKNSGISPYGYESTSVSFVAVLTRDGELFDILPLTEQNNGRPIKFILPKSMKKPGIGASLVLDNMAYVFGVSIKDKQKAVEVQKFEAAKELHLTLLKDAESPQAKAMVAFFKNWDINSAWKNERILKYHTENGKLMNGNVAFRLTDEMMYFHDCNEIKEIWLEDNRKRLLEKGEFVRQCTVTGKTSEIAQLHNQLRVKGASVMGASLISYKPDSHRSYNIEKSYGAAVSQEAMFKYTTALQYMLDTKAQRMYIGDDTFVYWAHSQNKKYEELWSSFFSYQEQEKENEEESIVSKETHEIISTLLKEGVRGIPVTPDFDLNTRFCCLGLTPNSARISIRFFYKDSFSEFIERVRQHYFDIQIDAGERGKKYININSLLYATISTKSRDKKVTPLLGGAVMRAILTGGSYPFMLFQLVIMRVKTEKEITQSRAAIIKGYLVRKSRINKNKEDLQVSLKKETRNTAYVLGRIFAILERIQMDALGDSLNATIKDKYFSTACATPAMVLPNLIKLAQHHIAKAKGQSESKTYWRERQLQECIGLLESESFPKTQSMEEQGRFILGYYQQVQNFYEKKNKDEEIINDSDIEE